MRQALEVSVGFTIGARELAFHGNEVIAFLHFETRLGERRAPVVFPVFARVDLLDAVEPAVRLEVHAEHADADTLAVGDVAAAHVGVRSVQLGDHLADDVVQVAAVGHPGKQRLIALSDRGPVGAAHFRVPVEVALQPPRLAQDLFPLLLRIGQNLHGGRVQLAVSHFLARCGIDDADCLSRPVDQLAAFLVEPVAADPLEQHLVFALLRVVQVQRAHGLRRAGAPHQRRLHGNRDVKDLVFTDVKLAVHSGRNWQL